MKWNRVRPGEYQSGDFIIRRDLYSDMMTRAGCFKTGWLIFKNGIKWWDCHLDTLSEAKLLCED